MMPKSSEIDGLLSRLEAATGPDAELGVDVLRALEPLYGAMAFRSAAMAAMQAVNGDPTASIDAALALVERVLTGPEEPTFCLDHATFGANWTCEFHWFINPAWHSRADMPTAPLAVLLALLRALSARPRP